MLENRQPRQDTAARKGRKQTDDDDEDDTEIKAVVALSQESRYQEGAS